MVEGMTTPCHEAEGYPRKDGYVQTMKLGYLEYAHRAKWIKVCGPIPDGMCVLHKCDNRSCDNEEHLFLGTNSDNTNDMLTKGRCGTIKYSKATVEQIRQLLTGGVHRSTIREITGVSISQISHIKTGRRRSKV